MFIRTLSVPLKPAVDAANDTAVVEGANETAVTDDEPIFGAWMQVMPKNKKNFNWNFSCMECGAY